MSGTERHEYLEQSIGVHLTPKGNAYINDHLEELLFKNGLSFSSGVFDQWEYKMSDPFTLDRLPERLQPYRKSFETVRNLLHSWLLGFDLNDPLLRVKASKIKYDAEFSEFKIVVDPRSSASELLLYVEIDVSKFAAAAETVRVTDQNNLFLGPMGLNRLKLNLSPQSKPFKISIPFTLHVDRNEGVVIKTADFNTNLNAVTLDAKFARPMVLPKVEVKINNKSHMLDQNALERDLLKFQPELIKALQSSLKEYFHDSGPQLVNGLIKDYFFLNAVDLGEIPPVGAPEGKPAPKLHWGLKVEDLGKNQDLVQARLEAFVEDPLAKRPFGPPAGGAARPAWVGGMEPSRFDMAISVYQSFVNRYIEASFNRGYFEKIDTKDGSWLGLVKSPEIRLDPQSRVGLSANEFRIHLNALRPVFGWTEKLAVKNPMPIEFDLILKVFKNADGDIRIAADRIDEESVRYDNNNVKIGLLKGKVKNRIKEIVHEANLGLRKKPYVLGDVPFPKEFYGIPLRIVDVQAENTGNFLIFLDYGV